MKPAHLLSLRSFLRSGHCSRLSVRACVHTPRPLSTSLGHGHATSHVILPSLRLAQNLKPSSSPHSLTFSTSPPPETPPTTLSDPSRPSLFYHLISAPNPVSTHLPAYAVSFLDRPSKDAQSPAVIGWLPAAASREGGEEAGLGDFKENANFLDVLHQVIKGAIKDGNDERLKAEAMQLGEGWMHINDDRNLPVMGRISSPDDIIASVRVEGGEVFSETYSPMPTYRTCTGDGLTTLSEGLERRLLERLHQIESE